MPLYEYLCQDCGQLCEILVTSSTQESRCPGCDGGRLRKLLSAPSSASGVARQAMPGPGDTACCGSSPGHAGCAGPGSCCGRTPR